MKRLIALLALAAFSFCYFVPVSEANVCVDPKIKRAQACGIVLDKFGEAVPNADVVFRLGIDSVATKTDEHGRFNEPKVAGTGFVVDVHAVGFFTASQAIEVVAKPTKSCEKPLYIMLEIGDISGCSMIRIKKSDLPIAKRD